MPRFVCTQCNAPYAEMTADGFCTNQPDCEYGSGWLKEVRDNSTPVAANADPAPETTQAIGFDREVGLCILMMDGSLSMSDPAFPSTDYPGNKYKLVAMNAAGGIWSLKNLTQADNALIALCVFAGSAELIWIKSVTDIIEEFENVDRFAGVLEETLQTQTPDQRTTNINHALSLANEIFTAYLKGDLSEYGGPEDFKPLTHKIVRSDGKDGEDFISIPNGRVMIYTDGEHNVTAAIDNPFEAHQQSTLLSAFIGEEDGKGVNQMKKIANVCPRHAPSRGFFLIHSPERIQTLKGVFRMASGASGFCPSCLAMEQPLQPAIPADSIPDEEDAQPVEETTS